MCYYINIIVSIQIANYTYKLMSVNLNIGEKINYIYEHRTYDNTKIV